MPVLQGKAVKSLGIYHRDTPKLQTDGEKDGGLTMV